MEFNPEDAGNTVLTDGDYDFEVASSEDCFSKFDETEEQVKLSLRIFHDGGTTFLNQWLSSNKDKIWKIKQFAGCVGLEEQFKAGKLVAADCLGKSGKLKLGRYTTDANVERNYVHKYLESDQPVKDKLKEFRADKKAAETETDIPF